MKKTRENEMDDNIKSWTKSSNQEAESGFRWLCDDFKLYLMFVSC